MPTPTFESILSSRPDPLHVLATTAPVVQKARYVRLDYAAVDRAADSLAHQRVEPPPWNFEYHFFDGSPRTVNYLFLLDTLNFCFWGKRKWGIEYKGKNLDGYWALAAALKRAVEEDGQIVKAEYLAEISPGDLARLLRGRGEIPLFAERWRGVRELGTVLRERWGGEAARLVERAEGDAARLARLVAENFSSFNDVAVYNGRGMIEVRFFKRAQIFVADLWGAFRGKEWGEFSNIGDLTAFADYKLPQLLRAWGILRYNPTLARQVDQRIELNQGSTAEIEIRAATLWAVEFLRESLAARGRILTSLQVDWILWHASQMRGERTKPYHRVRTVFY